MIHTNALMKKALSEQQQQDFPIANKLDNLFSKGLLETENGLFLKSFKNSLSSITYENSYDLTGRECTVNKFHIEDFTHKNLYQQAFLCLKSIWEMTQHYDCRVILGDNEGDLTVCFHLIREHESWIDSDIETYTLDGILYIDTKEFSIFPRSFSEFVEAATKP